uniref:Uncharacterized protein n=1 Tax=Anopheles atroparvus TaxID=41427 RepID=A0AAG5DDU6_ANOAO
MAELQNLNEFISQYSNTERTIKCTPEGISLASFADICDLAGAPEDVRQSLQSSVSVLRRSVSPADDNQTIASAINSIVSILIANAGRFVTVEQYGWLTRTTVAMALLNGLPCSGSSLAKRLLSSLEEIELAEYNYSPLVIHLVTKHLIDDIPLQGVYLLYVIKKLAITNSRILYYVAVALVFAGLDAITGSGKSEYRLHTVDEFLQYLDVLNMEHLHHQRHNLQVIYQLLKLLSLYENMVLVRHVEKLEEELKADHKSYANFFRVSAQQLKIFQLWLEKSSTLVHLFGNEGDIDYLILADLIQVDMFPLLDDLSSPGDLLG